MQRCLKPWLTLTLVLLASPTFAAPNDPIETNDYNVELFQGPVLAPLRVTGLAGAYTGYAEGVEGIPANAAAPAIRPPHSVTTFDWDVSLGIAFPAMFRKTDFDNDGHTGFAYEDFIFYTVGTMVQWGPLGVGVLGDTQRYNITPQSADQGDSQSTVQAIRIDATVGWALLGHQLIIGAGARAVWFDVRTSASLLGSRSLVSMAGVAPQVGMLVRPDYEPWRLGLTYRAPVSGDAKEGTAGELDSMGVRRAAGFAVPNSITIPWEVRAGFALQLGPRPLNPRWIDPAQQEKRARDQITQARTARIQARNRELDEIRDPIARKQRADIIDQEEAYLRQEEEARLAQLDKQMLQERRARYWNWPRERILVVAEALVTGPSPNAVSMESFLSQRETRSGQVYTVTPKLGLEGEPVVEHIKTRIGTYIEPSRTRGRPPRQHFTFGFDIRMFEVSGWGLIPPTQVQISTVVDLAPRYENLGLSIGAWY